MGKEWWPNKNHWDSFADMVWALIAVALICHFLMKGTCSNLGIIAVAFFYGLVRYFIRKGDPTV